MVLSMRWNCFIDWLVSFEQLRAVTKWHRDSSSVNTMRMLEQSTNITENEMIYRVTDDVPSCMGILFVCDRMSTVAKF